jgi:hypothetical protein
MTVELRERPILMSGPMVRAILEGRKTQTRRVIKPQPVVHACETRPSGSPRLEVEWRGIVHKSSGGRSVTLANLWEGWAADRCPYGVSALYRDPPDRLWVRERTRRIGGSLLHGEIRVQYEADGAEAWVDWPERLKGYPDIGQCLAYGCHREASRLTLEVCNVRIERLQDISEDDARAEGVELLPCTYINRCRSNSCPRHGVLNPYGRAFEKLWDSINGKTFPWQSNSFVWVVEFRRL